MVAEFPGEMFGITEDIICIYCVLHFGRGGSPSHLCRVSDPIARLHQLHEPSRPMRNAPYAYRSRMYIDDGLFIEVNIGDRRHQPTESWGGSECITSQ